MKSFHTFLEEERKKIDDLLPTLIEKYCHTAPETIKKAMCYSLNAGGKRIRPILLLATLSGYQKPLEDGYDVACAIEMIHTYSLIHDDLPAMDDDDYRRGKLTNHKVFGEAMAILAGDGLLTFSFKLLTASNIPTDKKVQLMERIADAAGPCGMVGGQVADMEGENKDLPVDALQSIHERKTGELLGVAVEAGAILAGVSEREQVALRHFAQHLGLAFQIKDDVLDVEGDEATIGKPIGSDEENNKSTYPKLLGLEGAKSKLSYHLGEAKKYLYSTSMDHTLLEGITDYIGNRTN